MSFARHIYIAISVVLSSPMLYTSDVPQQSMTTTQMQPLFSTDGSPHPALTQLLTCTNIPLHEKPYEQSTEQYILHHTQQKWLRKPDQERWHLSQAIAHNHNDILCQLNKLGITQEIVPERTQYDIIGVLGAAAPRLKERLQHAIDVYQHGIQANRIIIFTGDRPRSSEKEPREVLAACCENDLPLSDKEALPESETEIAHFLLQHIHIPKNMPHIDVVSAPRHNNGNRPNTRDTVTHWYHHGTQNCTSVLFISNQPYVRYQDTVVRSALPSCMHIETIGHAITHDEPTSVLLDTVARCIYAHINQK